MHFLYNQINDDHNDLLLRRRNKRRFKVSLCLLFLLFALFPQSVYSALTPVEPGIEFVLKIDDGAPQDDQFSGGAVHASLAVSSRCSQFLRLADMSHLRAKFPANYALPDTRGPPLQA